MLQQQGKRMRVEGVDVGAVCRVPAQVSAVVSSDRRCRVGVAGDLAWVLAGFHLYVWALKDQQQRVTRVSLPPECPVDDGVLVESFWNRSEEQAGVVVCVGDKLYCWPSLSSFSFPLDFDVGEEVSAMASFANSSDVEFVLGSTQGSVVKVAFSFDDLTFRKRHVSFEANGGGRVVDMLLVDGNNMCCLLLQDASCALLSFKGGTRWRVENVGQFNNSGRLCAGPDDNVLILNDKCVVVSKKSGEILKTSSRAFPESSIVSYDNKTACVSWVDRGQVVASCSDDCVTWSDDLIVCVSPSMGLFSFSRGCGLFDQDFIGVLHSSVSSPSSESSLKRLRAVEEELHQQSSSSSSSSRAGGSGLEATHADKVVHRVLRTFFTQENREKGLNVAMQDKSWSALLETSGHVLHGPTCSFIRRELDKSPSQRWADVALSADDDVVSRKTSNKKGERDEKFIPQLVHRHLLSKKERLFAMCDLFRLAGMLPRLTSETVGELFECQRRLLGCLKVLDLDAREKSDSCIVLLRKSMREVVEQEFTSDDLVRQLELVGLSVWDIFYSQVMSVERLLPKLHPKSFEEVCFCNRVFAALLLIEEEEGGGEEGEKEQLLEKEYLGAAQLSGDAVSWVDSDEVLAAVEKQIRRAKDLLDETSSPMWQERKQKLLPQLRTLVRFYLAANQRRGRLTQELASEMIKDLFLCYDQVDAAMALATEFVCHEALFQVGMLKGKSLLSDFCDRGGCTRVKMDYSGDCFELQNALGISNGQKWVVKKMQKEPPRWTFFNSSGAALVCDLDLRWKLVQEVDDDLLFHLVDVKSDANDSSFRQIVAWDGKTSLALTPDTADMFAVQHANEWQRLPAKVFENLLQQGQQAIIADIATSGLHNLDMNRFCSLHSQETKDLQWLEAIRTQQFMQAANVVQNHQSWQKLCLHAAAASS